MTPDPETTVLAPNLPADSRESQAVIALNAEIATLQKERSSLLARNAELTSFVENASIGMHWVDPNGTILWANAAELQMLGYRREEYIGQNITKFHADQSNIERMLACLARGERLQNHEAKLLHQDGSIRVGLIDSSVLWDGIRFVHTQCFTRDITQQKNAEAQMEAARDEALAATRTKDKFLADLSHELRTPLSPVMLIAEEAMADPAVPESTRKLFQIIATNVALEARLIDDLLDITRIAQDKLILSQTLVDLCEVLRQALAIVRADFEDKRILVDAEFGSAQIWVFADATRLMQIFWNVLRNAAKFTPGGGRVTLIVNTSMADRTVAVTVTDSGIGLTKEELARLFVAFSQGDHSNGGVGRRFGGLGLGLAISRKLVHLQGGEIEASSAGRGTGATFKIRLPLAPPNLIP